MIIKELQCNKIIEKIFAYIFRSQKITVKNKQRKGRDTLLSHSTHKQIGEKEENLMTLFRRDEEKNCQLSISCGYACCDKKWSYLAHKINVSELLNSHIILNTQNRIKKWETFFPIAFLHFQCLPACLLAVVWTRNEKEELISLFFIISTLPICPHLISFHHHHHRPRVSVFYGSSTKHIRIFNNNNNNDNDYDDDDFDIN